MSGRINFNHLRKINWYRQGGAIYLFYVFEPYFSVNETIGYDRCILCQSGDVNTAFFGRDEEAAKTRWIINKQKKNRGFIDDWISDWDRKNQKLLNFCAVALRTLPEKWSDKKLADFLRRYNYLALEHWKKGILCEWTDPDGAAILRLTTAAHGINLSDEEIAILTAPEKLTFVQEEFIKRVKIAKRQAAGHDIASDLRRHASAYHWIKNNWAYVEELDASDFGRLVVGDARHLDERRKEMKNILTNLTRAKMQKHRLLKKKKIPAELTNVLYMFSRISDWRDERKKRSVCIPNCFLYKILKQLAAVNDIPEDLAGALCWNEVKGWKMNLSLINILKKRRAGGIHICDKNKYCRWVYGERADKIFQTLISSLTSGGELSGVSASHGRARGPVKKIETKADFAKMRPGDILVATMTRPEYIPLMKIAGAIVTNEGGLTCHAAIASRELGKPCIIGTQVATEALKDGDLVEVDADSGVVRKI